MTGIISFADSTVRTRVLLGVAGVLAIAIFMADTVTDLDVAIAVLYVGVVLVVARFLQGRGILITGLGCISLTVLSFAISHYGEYTASELGRCVVSSLAIAITTALAVQNQGATTVLKEQAHLLDLTHDTVFVRDASDIITYWNRGAEELYGWTSEQAVGRVSHELMRTVFPGPLKDIIESLRRDGRWEGELVHMKKDGSPVTVASRWSIQRDDQGRHVATLETNNDVTERKLAQEALQKTTAELAHVTRVTTLGELTASIAHEVNQPLAGVVTNAQAGLRWLGRETPDLAEARSNLERIVGDAQRAAEVIRRLRSLARRTEPVAVELDVNEIIREVVALTQREALNHHVALRLELSPESPRILGDRVQLQQVLINLVVNAIDAMASVAPDRRELSIRSFSDDGVVVAVQDTGVGVDLATVEQLFEAFYTTKPNGMGMGLSICRSIVEAHGGRLWWSQNTGPGTTFQFKLASRAQSKP